MRSGIMIPLVGLAFVLSACSSGYYDSSGNYVGNNGQVYVPANLQPATPTVQHSVSVMSDPVSGTTTTTRTTTVASSGRTNGYVRAGYYDANGSYISPADAPQVPSDMMPPPGMCRVWYPDLSLDKQPNMQTCNGIRNTVPPDTYVIYGG